MDRTDNQLRACVKALDDVIGPAMDGGDSQAAEQLFLVTDYLRYLESRLDHLHARDLFEVDHYAAMATAILDDAGADAPDPPDAPAADEPLRTALTAAQAAVADPRTPTPRLRDAAAQLAAAIRTTIRDAASGPEAVRARIESTVVAMSAEKIEADRAWHLPQGFDPDPGSVLGLDEALTRSAQTTTTTGATSR